MVQSHPQVWPPVAKVFWIKFCLWLVFLNYGQFRGFNEVYEAPAGSSIFVAMEIVAVEIVAVEIVAGLKHRAFSVIRFCNPQKIQAVPVA